MPRRMLLLLILLPLFWVAACGPDEPPAPTFEQTNGRQQAVVQPLLATFTATPSIVLLPTATPVIRQRSALGETHKELGVVIANTAILNVRTAPNTEASILTTLSAGDCQTVKERTADWYALLLDDGRTGWAAATYLTPSATCPAIAQVLETTNVAPIPAPQKGVVTAPLLNVRAGPGPTYAVLGQVAGNDCIDVLATSGDWLQIAKSPTVAGWCSQEFVTLVNTCPVLVQPVAATAPVATVASAPPLSPADHPFAPNAMTITDAYLFECFGGGANELRFVTASTPVQVLGTGAFSPPYDELGSGPFLKIRLWDGQYAWLPAAAVNVDLATQPALSAQCESADRLDWSTLVPPTPTSYPSWVTNPTPSQPTGCCKICRKGKACGDSCISASYTCHKGPGCACNG